MGGKDQNYQVVYRGESLSRFIPGGWVFFQRPKECGGGYWLGRTYEDCFWLELERPVSLFDGLGYMMEVNRMLENAQDFDDDFRLES